MGKNLSSRTPRGMITLFCAALFLWQAASPSSRANGQTLSGPIIRIKDDAVPPPKCEMSNGSAYPESDSTHRSDYPSTASVSGTGPSRVIAGLPPVLARIDGETTQNSDELGTQMVFQQDRPKKETVACTIGVGNVEQNKIDGKHDKIDAKHGDVRFKVLNTDCPSGGSTTVTVGIAPFETTGNLAVIGYTPSNTKNVTVPAPGTQSNQETIQFTLSGAGSTKFKVAITACNGESCTSQNWTLNPSSRDTNAVNYP
jgi:hypothetical protein